ncbi:hypothetical protein [Arcobacter sp.]|uniref:hypothetical protein n=1 Tax=Arcobacter sp. TaxID=1872629 RepID=UPI003D140919
MKTKTSSIVLNNFKKLKEEVGNFQNLWTDRGGEYVNKKFIKWCNENNINLLIANNTERYIDNLNEMVYNYNNKKHRMIKDTPSNVYNSISAERGVHGHKKPTSSIKHKLQVNDYVRI